QPAVCPHVQVQSGIAAVEFAAILPFMLVAYLGGVELGDGVAIDRKVAVTTRSVADLASRYTTIKNADMASILGAAAAVIAPYDPGQLAVTVSQVSVDPKGNAIVTWSDTKNGSARAVNSPITLPGSMATCGGSTSGCTYILGEVKYSYTPTLGYVLTGTLGLSNQIFMSPRESASIQRVNA
ncbi:MAG TPA: TadE/TadG family type IV pilus assembly protein, partial [Xanthobacteraceae bacterium]